MWYLQDLMDACIRQIVFRAIVIFLIGLLIGIFIGCQTPYTDDFLGQGISVDDITDDLDAHAAPGECITDGFDWLCRGELHIVTLEIIKEVEVIHEVEVPVEVEVIKEVEKPITIRELYAVIVKPNETIQTPLGIIQTDATGEVVSAPVDVSVESVIVESDDSTPPQANTPQVPNTQQGGGNTVGDGTDDCEGGYVVWTQVVNGWKQSGVICSRYVVINADNTITFTGSDGEVDAGDTVREYVKVETGYSYEAASKRAPEILSE